MPAALIALAALAVATGLTIVVARPDPREVALRIAAAGFVVGLGVGAILALLVPTGWIALVWRRTIGRQRTAANVGLFVIALAVTLALVGLAVLLYVQAQPTFSPPPEG